MTRKRRTKLQTEILDNQILSELSIRHPQSVRHVFYRMTDPRLEEPVPKTEHGYYQVMHRISELRERGSLPWHYVVDLSRRALQYPTYRGLSDFLKRAGRSYRTDPWADHPTMLSVWAESRSIASVIEGICYEWRLPLFPSVGFSSKTFLYEAARSISHDYQAGKSVTMLYMGDYDPAGCIIDEAIEEGISLRLSELVNQMVHIEFLRIAVNEDQIEEHNLPTKPRKSSELRKPEIKQTVEIESMPVELLKNILEKRIESILPKADLKAAFEHEDGDFEILTRISNLLQAEERNLVPPASSSLALRSD